MSLANKKFDTGKLPHKVLERLFQKLPHLDKNVVIGPGIGVDAAAIRFDDRILIAKSDPITFASEQQGQYAVHVNANDIACMGGKPKWFLATLLLPGKSDAHSEILDKITDDLAKACREIGVSIVGGHTEITPAVTQPLIAGTMLGEVDHGDLLDIRACQPGDRLILVSGIAIEATAIIAQHRKNELSEIFDVEFIAHCKNFTKKPGISVLRAAKIASRKKLARAMHDPTEGGLVTALHEIADACQCGVEVQEEHIIYLPESRLLCEHYQIEILGAISSGALLVVTPPEKTEMLLEAYEERGLPAADIGFLTESPARRKLVSGEKKLDLPRYDRDEIGKIF
jgi:hydrogenase maturation factor